MSELGSALGTRDGKLLGEAGMMTKEKLMRLIASVPCFGEEHVASCPDRIMGCCGQSVKMDYCAIVHMAEWLLSNGVVVTTPQALRASSPDKGSRIVNDNPSVSCADSRGQEIRELKTNADRIRAMSDKELATFLSEWAERCLAWYGEYGETLDWLRQPVKDGEDE